MVAGLLLFLPCLSAGFLALSARFESLVSSLLCAYVTFVVITVGTVLALSPFRAVDRSALPVAEAVIFALVLGAWWYRGRPGPSLSTARAGLRQVLGRPETALFLAATLLLLGYELVLALTVPANNWDSLTYHLARVASWFQHGGFYWIPNAPTDRINEFQPLAEQENLYLFAATRSGVLFAVPQYMAQLAILVAVYGSARRLGFSVRPSACAAFLLSTFSLLALESTTAQNDLVAASFPVVAACFLLSGGTLESTLAGVAVGLGLGAKLTTALVLPVLVLLAVLRGRRRLLQAAAGGLAGFALIASWGFVLNLIHTGHLLGHGGGRVGDTTTPSWPGSAITAVDVLYQAMDTSVLSHGLIVVLAIAGLVAAAVVAGIARRRFGTLAATRHGAIVALVLAAPLLVIGLAAIIAAAARAWGHPIPVGGMVRRANEDRSAFGPLGSLLLLAIPILGLVSYRRRRTDARLLTLALALPCFLLLLALESKFNSFLSRFLIVPVTLSAPVMALLFRDRPATVAIAVSAAIAGAVTIVNDDAKPFRADPWSFTQAQAVSADGRAACSRRDSRLRQRTPT